MPPLRLLSTDFDGTLIEHPSDGKCSPALAEALVQVRASGGLWAVNTGRTLDHAIEGLEVFDAPVTPDFLLTIEREVHESDGSGGWRDFGDWNHLCRERHDALFHKSSGVLDLLTDRFAGFPDTTLIEENGRLIGLVTTDESVMDGVASELAAFKERFPDLGYQRNTIYLRFCHRAYDKGTSLAAVARSLNIEPAWIFAAGDHFNDLPMLDPRVAANLACPSNAIPEVKATVARAGGFVASHPAGDGIAAALRHFHSSP